MAFVLEVGVLGSLFDGCLERRVVTAAGDETLHLLGSVCKAQGELRLLRSALNLAPFLGPDGFVHVVGPRARFVHLGNHPARPLRF